MNIEQTILENNIKVFKTEEGQFRLRYDYYDDYFNNCSIWITTKEITEKIIKKILR